jgi:hypothetical protein
VFGVPKATEYEDYSIPRALRPLSKQELYKGKRERLLLE